MMPWAMLAALLLGGPIVYGGLAWLMLRAAERDDEMFGARLRRARLQRP